MEQENTIQAGGRGRRILVVLAVCVSMGIGVVAFWPGEKEPEYNGKNLSEWCLQYWPWMTGGREQAGKAINHIGTNGLPFLVAWLRYDRLTPKQQLADGFEDLKHELHRSTAARNSLRLPRTRAEIAQLGFEALGTNAAPAIPMLAKLMRERASSPHTVRAAAYSLVCTGEKGIGDLATFVRDRAQTNRIHAVMSLATVQQNARPALELLMELIQGTDEELAVESAAAIDSASTEPEMRIAILRKGAVDPRRRVRIESLFSLGRFGPKAASAAPELTRALKDDDPGVRRAARKACAWIAPELSPEGSD